MKKIRVLLAAVAAAALLFGAGLADVSYDYQKGVLTVTCKDAMAGQSYAFLAARGTEDHYSLDASNLVFAGQLKADAAGEVSAAFIGRVEEACVFVLGGVFSSGASPRVIGSYGPGAEEKTSLGGALNAISDEAFMGCDFVYVYLGDSMTKIGARAFKGCAGMVYIEIPSSVTNIGEDAFSGCGKLTIGCAAGSAAQTYASAHGIRVEIIP